MFCLHSVCQGMRDPGQYEAMFSKEITWMPRCVQNCGAEPDLVRTLTVLILFNVLAASICVAGGTDCRLPANNRASGRRWRFGLFQRCFER